MGIAEREGLRGRAHEQPQAAEPPLHKRMVGRGWMVVVAAIAGIGLYQASGAFVPRTPKPHPVVVGTSEPASNVPVTAVASKPAASKPAAVEVQQHAARSVHPARHAPRRHQVVTKCIRDGAVSFTDAPCDVDEKTELVAVNPDRNLTDGLLPSQVALAGTQEQATPREAAPAEADPAALRRHQCEALEARVRAIDQRAGEALPPQTQDELAELRREYRDAQFRMHC